MTKASDRIRKYKVKNDPKVVYLRIKQVRDLAAEKYGIWMENFARLEEFLAGLGLSFPERGRAFQFSREFYDLIRTDPERAANLWRTYGLDPNVYDYIWRLFRAPQKQTIISTCTITL